MAAPRLTIDLDAVASNWRAMDALSGPEVQTGAVVKADAYGLGVTQVAPVLRAAGAT
ncbi:MAG: alanine racemase, partial [Pseudomonadota bacterium]